jgi:hypothetical protein
MSENLRGNKTNHLNKNTQRHKLRSLGITIQKIGK